MAKFTVKVRRVYGEYESQTLKLDAADAAQALQDAKQKERDGDLEDDWSSDDDGRADPDSYQWVIIDEAGKTVLRGEGTAD